LTGSPLSRASSTCARTEGEQALVIFPDGGELSVGDPRLDEFLSTGYRDQLRLAKESPLPPYHDAAPLHVLTAASLRWQSAQSRA
jgi:hypothetical protein